MTDQLGEYLGALPVLLILDNCEQVIEPVAHLTSTLLRGCPALHVLATSRELMRTEGEVAFPIEPLAFPETHSPLGDDDLRTFPAIELFLQRAEAASPGFRVEDKEALARLCAGLDGLPLALELAAARSRTLSVPEMLERIEDRFNLLSQGDRAGLGHHLTLEAAISWSYELLEDDERMLLDRLAVFSGFELDGAEQVCSDSNLEKASIADVLGRLVDKSLVQVEAVDHPRRRYRLLEAIRSFALARLRDSGLQARYQHRHAEFYLELADAFAEVAEAGGRAA
jgi:predicted ATPase